MLSSIVQAKTSSVVVNCCMLVACNAECIDSVRHWSEKRTSQSWHCRNKHSLEFAGVCYVCNKEESIPSSQALNWKPSIEKLLC